MIENNKRGFPLKPTLGFVGLSAVIVGIAIAKKTGGIDYGLAKRSVGIVLGLMLIGAANLLPKFRLFEWRKLDPATTQAAERFAGWIFVIAGAAYVAVWAFAPISQVMLTSSIVGLAAFALVAIDWVRRVWGAEARSTSSHLNEMNLSKRLLLGTILLTVGWGVAIFLVDYVWGDAVSRWVGIAYSIVVPTVLSLGAVSVLNGRTRLDT